MRVWPDPTDPQGFRVHLFNGDDWQAAKDHVARALGMQEWRPGDRPSRRPDPSVAKPQSDRSRNVDLARTIHDKSVPAKGTLVERYLSGRGLPVADALRFHPSLRHLSGGIWPAMVALVTNGGTARRWQFIGPIWRARDRKGADRAAEDDARSLPCWCGAPRQARGRLMVGEGIETCLAAMLAAAIPPGPHFLPPGCVASICRTWSAGSSCSLMVTTPARWRLGMPRCAGSARAGACTSPAHRKGWISTTCYWARLASRMARYEKTNTTTKLDDAGLPDRRRHRRPPRKVRDPLADLAEKVAVQSQRLLSRP